MIHRHIWSIVFLLFLASCTLVKEQEPVIKDPEVLKISPSVIKDESWRAHDIKILVVCDLEAKVELEDTPWARVTGSEVTGSGQTTVTVRMDENEGNEPRQGMLMATCGTRSAAASFTQNALGTELGIWNYDGKGGNIPFEPLKFQTSVRRYPDGTAVSRLLNPLGQKFLMVKGLPVNPVPGAMVKIDLCQNWIEDMPYQTEKEIETVKSGDGKVWLADGDAVYILKL